MIEIVGLRKSFKKQDVLKGIDLTIHDREVIAIIGRSGSGKSVFLKHIIGLIKPDSGKIVIDGMDITGLKRLEMDRIREKFGVLFQGGALFDSMTVFENVAFPLMEKTRLGAKEIMERVLHSLHDVGLAHMGKKYPAEISGGMQKRVALARALIEEPSIVLFDEPTTGLDPIIMSSIHRLIRTTHEKYRFTGIIISHEIPEIFNVADRVAMLNDGVIVETGTPEEIKGSANPFVRQFITGGLEGPMRVLD
ncbi:MAG: ABC transporter ATP-binding protein [Nitrospirales bacterium]|nr:ABC transporter ATP-binding protein [Nitrospirales bacterium]